MPQGVVRSVPDLQRFGAAPWGARCVPSGAEPFPDSRPPRAVTSGWVVGPQMEPNTCRSAPLRGATGRHAASPQPPLGPLHAEQSHDLQLLPHTTSPPDTDAHLRPPVPSTVLLDLLINQHTPHRANCTTTDASRARSSDLCLKNIATERNASGGPALLFKLMLRMM